MTGVYIQGVTVDPLFSQAGMLKRRVNEDAPSRSGAGLARLLVVCVGVFSCGCLSQRHVVLDSRMAAIQLPGSLCRFSWITQRMVPFLCFLHAASECFDKESVQTSA